MVSQRTRTSAGFCRQDTEAERRRLGGDRLAQGRWHVHPAGALLVDGPADVLAGSDKSGLEPPGRPVRVALREDGGRAGDVRSGPSRCR
ncbi:hypothetical protein [Fodinicola feengrottensis]|uniref:hypothetical protein n=1 Tax=Fodinicola feengrottensis TaxID=435914 RepID=UPI002442D37B|nr:hypothetical protein [Fodinicola feengrottensis]